MIHNMSSTKTSVKASVVNKTLLSALHLEPVVNVQGMSMSRSSGHLPCSFSVAVLASVCAHVPLMIRYAPEFTILHNKVNETGIDSF